MNIHMDVNRAENLTGKTYGALTVLYRTANMHGRTCWMCRCSCGKEKPVLASYLKSGKVKSCGCRAHMPSHNQADLTGIRFGRLTALKATEKRKPNGSVVWLCRCSCGRTVEVSEDSLVQGNTISCGCRQKEVQQNIGNMLHRIDGTCIEILEKRKYRKDNTSGFQGVCRQKTGRYIAYIGFKGKRYYLGSYSDLDAAVTARINAENLIYGGFLDAWRKWKDTDPTGQTPFVFEVYRKNHKLYIRKEHNHE